jgi:hypothetical protein
MSSLPHSVGFEEFKVVARENHFFNFSLSLTEVTFEYDSGIQKIRDFCSRESRRQTEFPTYANIIFAFRKCDSLMDIIFNNVTQTG